MLTVCTRSYLIITAEPLMQSIMIALVVMKIGFTTNDKYNTSLTNKDGKLKTFGEIKKILGLTIICDLDFDVPKRGLILQQVKALNEKLPSESDIANVDDIELQDLSRSTSRIMEDLITDMKDIQSQTDESIENPLCELLRLDKQFRSIRGSLKVEQQKKLS